MKKTTISLLISSALVGAAAFSGAANAADCMADKIHFRTTQWVSPFSLWSSSLGDVVIPTVVDGSPVSVPVAAGVFTKPLDVAPGFKVKKVLVCSNAVDALGAPIPLPGVTVALSQSLPVPVSYPMSFQRMAVKAPGCAVYSLNNTADDWWAPVAAVDPRVSPTVLSINVPAGTTGEITALALRLQADPASPLWTFVPGHQHAYLTGRGRGHNNTVARTSGPISDSCVFVVPEDLDDVVDFIATPDLPPLPTTPTKPGKGPKK